MILAHDFFNSYELKPPIFSPPSKSVSYFAYKNGECREFESQTEALQFSSLYEIVDKNKDALRDYTQEYRKQIREYERLRWDHFETELKKHYELPEAIINVILNESCDFASEHDIDVGEVFDGFVNLYHKIS